MGFDPFTMMLGGTALQGILGGIGSLFGSSSQSKAIDRAMQFQMAQFNMAKEYQQRMLEQAKAVLGEGKGAAASYLTGGRDEANKYLQGTLESANALTQGGMSGALAALDPYAALGEAGVAGFDANRNYLLNPVVMDQAALEATPGYQFALKQGLRGQQQSATTRGLGLSGAQLKGAAEYATGLADQTYGNQFTRELQNRNDLFTRLAGYTGIGQGAAGAQANLLYGGNEAMANRTMGVGSAIGNNIMGTGGALAGNEMDVARAIAQIMFGTGANVGSQNMNLAALGGNALIQQGNVNAAGLMGMLGSIGNAFGSIGQMAFMPSMLGNMFSTSGGGKGLFG